SLFRSLAGDMGPSILTPQPLAQFEICYFMQLFQLLGTSCGNRKHSHISFAPAIRRRIHRSDPPKGGPSACRFKGGYAMRTFDLAPLYRSTVGFDRLFSLLDQGLDGSAPGYPPYNIERTGENAYRVSVAVAGFNEPELSVVAKENTLTIRGEKNAKEE